MVSPAESNTSEMAAPSTFSYAQAAKGQGTTSSVAPTPNPSAQAHGSQPVSSANKAALSPDKSTDQSEMPRTAEAPSSIVDKQEVDSSFGSESDLRSETATERRLDSKRDDDAARLDRPWRRAEKAPRSSSSAAQSVDESDSKKPKSAKAKPFEQLADDPTTGADKEQSPPQEAPKFELSEAPIPSVNIWQQRKEAQLAKTKPASDPSEEPTNGVPAQPEGPKQPSRSGDVSPTAREVTSTNGAKPIRKTADATRPERNGSRGSRSAEGEVKEAKVEVSPFVEDAASWPTPETAIKEEKRKSVPVQVDRQDKEPKEGVQEEGSQAKPRQKGKWVTYDYVPSVSFETQIPPLRHSKPRGGARGSNGPRAPIGATAGEKTAPASQAGKTAEFKDRPREPGTASTRTSSVPPSASRAPMDAAVAKEQKKYPGNAAGEKAKDMTSQLPDRSHEQSHAARERPEGRGEKGRGGFRSRGGHHTIGSHSQHQQASAGFTAGSMPPRPQGPYSPPPRQGGHGQTFMSHQPRGGRGRNGAGANFHRMSLPNGSTRLPPVQTQFGPYEYPMAPLSAIPFQPQPYWDSVVLSLLKNQIEYYFSIENLCKDMYLRRRMDSQGLVNLHFVAAFKRIRELTSDMAMIRAVCESSSELDFVVGEDDVERLRRKTGWQSFVLPMEDRDDFARNSGPARLTFKNRVFGAGPQYGAITPGAFGVSPPLGYNPQAEAQFQQLADGHGMNEVVNGSGGMGHGGFSLSAEVPDFPPLGSAAPSGPASLGQGLGNRSAGAAAAGLESSVDTQAAPSAGKPNGCGDEPAASMASSGLDRSGHGAAHS